MKQLKFLTYGCVIILGCLLNSIQIEVMIPTVSFGGLSAHVLTVEKVRSPLLQSARFVFAKPKPTVLVLVGDVLLARNVEYLMVKHGSDYPYQGIDFNTLAITPYVVGNFEASIPTEHIPTAALQMNFSVAEPYIKQLRQAGFTHLSLANNHSNDYNYQNTQAVLTATDLIAIGRSDQVSAESVSYLSTADKIVALVTINALETTLSTGELKKTFAEYEKKSDLQIVYIHWGEEYDEKNSIKQRQQAEKLVAAGADLIVGHHPHVVQNVDLIAGVPIFYSLGNYIFDQYFSAETQNGLLLHIELQSNPAIHIVPVSSEGSLSQPHRMSAKAHQLYLNKLAKNSHELLQSYLERGIVPLDIGLATSVKIAMMN